MVTGVWLAEPLSPMSKVERDEDAAAAEKALRLAEREQQLKQKADAKAAEEAAAAAAKEANLAEREEQMKQKADTKAKDEEVDEFADAQDMSNDNYIQGVC